MKRPGEITVVDVPIRKFAGGGMRDTDKGKLDFNGFLSPIVLEAFAQYMNIHMDMPDGSRRSSDNWKNGFGEKHYDICMKSLHRHFQDAWMEHEGYESREGMMPALMGMLFNIMAYAKQYLEDESDEEYLDDTMYWRTKE